MYQFARLGRIITVSILLTASLSACSLDLFDREPQSEATPLVSSQKVWQSGQQYVEIVSAEAMSASNQHPVVITEQVLKTVLSSLYVKERFILRSYRNPVYSVEEQQILSTALANALEQARRDEDVKFMMLAMHPDAFDNKQKANSGRVFIDDAGRLNIIFAALHEDYSEADSATSDLSTATRRQGKDLNADIDLGIGQSFYVDPTTGEQRQDWVMIDIPSVLAKEQDSSITSTRYVSPELLQDVAQGKQEAGNLRQEVSSMKEVLFELTDEVERLRKEINELKADRP